MKSITSNEYYGKLNRRFDFRVRLLGKMGFRQRCLKTLDAGGDVRDGGYVFTHERACTVGARIPSIHPCEVMHARGRAFAESVMLAIPVKL